jgi:hypothetical protein
MTVKNGTEETCMREAARGAPARVENEAQSLKCTFISLVVLLYQKLRRYGRSCGEREDVVGGKGNFASGGGVLRRL